MTMYNPENDNKTVLQLFIDKIKKRMTLQKIMSTPRTFEDLHSDFYDEMSKAYYTIKLCDDWLDEVPMRIEKWINVIDEYFDEFIGSWEYYATAKRLDWINQEGAEEEDLDDDGNIRKHGLTHDDLRFHTIINELYMFECRDIVQDFIPDDINHIVRAVMFDTAIDIKQMFRDVAGKSIDTYVMDEETGELHLEEFPEYELRKVSNELDAESQSDVLFMLGYIIYDMCRKLEQMKEHMFEDNKDFLMQFRDDCLHIRKMELEQTTSWHELKEHGPADHSAHDATDTNAQRSGADA